METLKVSVTGRTLVVTLGAVRKEFPIDLAVRSAPFRALVDFFARNMQAGLDYGPEVVRDAEAYGMVNGARAHAAFSRTARVARRRA